MKINDHNGLFETVQGGEVHSRWQSIPFTDSSLDRKKYQATEIDIILCKMLACPHVWVMDCNWKNRQNWGKHWTKQKELYSKLLNQCALCSQHSWRLRGLDMLLQDTEPDTAVCTSLHVPMADVCSTRHA